LKIVCAFAPTGDTGAGLVALAGQQPGLPWLSLTAALIGSLLLVRAILGVMNLTGGSLRLAGHVCCVGALALDVPAPAMAQASCCVPAWAALLAAATTTSDQPPADHGQTRSENQPRRRHDQVGAGHVNLLRVCEGWPSRYWNYWRRYGDAASVVTM
jgi:hypothetical protein